MATKIREGREWPRRLWDINRILEHLCGIPVHESQAGNSTENESSYFVIRTTTEDTDGR